MGQRRPHHGRVLEQRVRKLLLEALRRKRDVGLRHLPVVDWPAVAGHRRRGGERVARLRELTSESEEQNTGEVITRPKYETRLYSEVMNDVSPPKAHSEEEEGSTDRPID